MDEVLIDAHIRPLEGWEAAAGRLRNPLLIAAFGGAAGHTAAAAVSYFAEEWDARPLAEFDPDEFYDFTVARPVVRIHEGERVVDWPDARFLLARIPGVDRDVVLFAGIEPHFRWRRFAEAFAQVLTALEVSDVVIASSFTGATPHTRPSPVLLSAAGPELAALLGLTSNPPRYQGPATFAMALAVALREGGWRPATLNAVAPFYTGVDPSPHATRALLDVFDHALGTQTPRDRVDARIAEVDAHAEQAMARSADLRTLVANLEQQYEETLPGEAAPRASAKPPLEADEVLRDVEALLRGRGDAPGHGSAPRRTA